MWSPGSSNARRVRLFHSALFIALHAACAHQPESRRAVAIMPGERLGTATEAETLRRAAEQAIEDMETYAPCSAEDVGTALVGWSGTCGESCLAAVGRAVDADAVLALTLGGFGQTRVIRSQVLDVSSGIVVHDSEETVVGDAAALEDHAVNLARRLFPSPEPPWYRRGWFIWTSAALVVAAGVVAVVLSAETPDPRVVHVGDIE